MSLNSSTNAIYVDISTYDDLESYMYGLGTQEEADAGLFTVSQFYRKYMRTSWFAQVPTPFNIIGAPGWGSSVVYSLPRNTDYATYVWFEVTIGEVQPKTGYTVRWPWNLGHHIFDSIVARSGQLDVQEITPEFMDFWSAFTLQEGHANGYANMIGNIAELTAPHKAVGDVSPGVAHAVFEGNLPEFKLLIPIPIWFSFDVGSPFPVSSLIYGELSLRVRLRNWTELLIVEQSGGGSAAEKRIAPTTSNFSTYITAPPVFRDMTAVANTAVVTKNERNRLAAGTRNFIIRQSQTIQNSVNLSSVGLNQAVVTNLNFGQAIAVIFFGLRNVTFPNERANYTTHSPDIDSGSGTWYRYPAGAADPIRTFSIRYDNQHRLPSNMDIRYYSLINPKYHAPRIPKEIGYHMYSFATDITSVDPSGSPNFGKIGTTEAVFTVSQSTVDSVAGVTELGRPVAQSFDFVACAVNHTVFSVESGVPGFPVY